MSMKHIRANLTSTVQNARMTERGELMKYFCERINSGRLRDGLAKITMGRMGKTLEKIPTKDLYYLKSVCDQAENFGKKFWYSLNPDKYEKANKGKFVKKDYRN